MGDPSRGLSDVVYNQRDPNSLFSGQPVPEAFGSFDSMRGQLGQSGSYTPPGGDVPNTWQGIDQQSDPNTIYFDGPGGRTSMSRFTWNILQGQGGGSGDDKNPGDPNAPPNITPPFPPGGRLPQPPPDEMKPPPPDPPPTIGPPDAPQAPAPPPVLPVPPSIGPPQRPTPGFPFPGPGFGSGGGPSADPQRPMPGILTPDLGNPQRPTPGLGFGGVGTLPSMGGGDLLPPPLGPKSATVPPYPGPPSPWHVEDKHQQPLTGGFGMGVRYPPLPPL